MMSGMPREGFVLRALLMDALPVDRFQIRVAFTEPIEVVCGPH
jgi:hypothetical protein